MKHPSGRLWTASELRKMPADQRDAILSAAAEAAEKEYLNNPELTAFEAFDPILDDDEQG